MTNIDRIFQIDKIIINMSDIDINLKNIINNIKKYISL